MIHSDQLHTIRTDLLSLLEDVLTAQTKRFILLAVDGMVSTLTVFDQLVDDMDTANDVPDIDLDGNPLDSPADAVPGPKLPLIPPGSV